MFDLFTKCRLKSLTQKAILVLEDGTCFEGASCGGHGNTVGEVVFNTSITGYQEILTDPSYCKQIVTMTSPHVGNYGINANDLESKKIQVAGFVVKEGTDIPSNWQSKGSLDSYLKREEIVGIQSIDTRALTRHIRDFGAMNGIISSIEKDVNILKRKLDIVPSMNGQDLVKEVTCNEPYTWDNKSEGSFRVAAIDYGIKHNILRLLNDCLLYTSPSPRDCLLSRMPSSA